MKNLFSKLFKRTNWSSRPHIDQYWHLPVDEMSNLRLHNLFAPLIKSNPVTQNFAVARELMWVDNSHPPVRPVLAFERMKGGVLWPIYGLSVDLVPTIVGKRAIMKAGIKGLKFDIKIDPRNHMLDIHYMWGPDAALKDAHLLLPSVLSEAAKFWSKYQTTASLADAVRFQENHTTALPGLGVDNYVQAGFACSFLFAAAGDKENAERYWNAKRAYTLLDETGLRKAEEQFNTLIQAISLDNRFMP